jgi:hypothetical protein
MTKLRYFIQNWDFYLKLRFCTDFINLLDPSVNNGKLCENQMQNCTMIIKNYKCAIQKRKKTKRQRQRTWMFGGFGCIYGVSLCEEVVCSRKKHLPSLVSVFQNKQRPDQIPTSLLLSAIASSFLPLKVQTNF